MLTMPQLRAVVYRGAVLDTIDKNGRLHDELGRFATKNDMGALADEAVKSGASNKTLKIAKVGAREVREAKEKAGLDIDGYTHTADLYAVRHAINQHGDKAKEAKRGQIAIGRDDIAALPDAIASPDAVVYGAKNQRKQDLIASIKRMDDGTMLVVEEVRTGRKTLALASLRKYPAAKDFDSVARTLLSNARSDGGDALIIVKRAGSGNGN
jgi:hypothetical protein